MKFILLFCVFGENIFSQSQTQVNVEHLEYLVYYHFLYQKKVIKEREAFTILYQTRDEKIMALTTQAKNAKNMKLLGYLGIPAAIAFIGFQEATIFDVYNTNGTTNKSRQNKYRALSYSCLAVSIACPTIAIVMKRRHKTKMGEAVKLFNEKY